jgi:phospholipase C
MIGHTDQANHQYGLSDFWTAADSGHLPSAGFLKAPVYQDGHEGYSNPLDEQTIIVNTIITYNNYLNGIALPKLLPTIILQY